MQKRMLGRLEPMKRSILFTITITLAIVLFTSTFSAAHAGDFKPEIGAPSGILIDARTGAVLWEKNPDEKRQMASTTKIMTAIVTIERKSFDDTVTINEDVFREPVYGIKLKVGEVMTLRDLLYAIMLNSANDAAIAIADHVSGSVEEFAKLMTSEATRIGARNTNYVNPHGLVNGDMPHYSTARDLSKIARYAMKNEDFAKLVSTKEWKLNRADPKAVNIVQNRDKLLWSYPGATGIKTGFTKAAGYCLVSSAKRGDVSLIAVVLGADSQDSVFIQSAALLEYGFGLYGEKRLITKGRVYKTIKTKYGHEIDLVAESTVDKVVRHSAETSETVSVSKGISLPIKKGAVLGRVAVYQSGKQIAASSLIANDDINKPTIFWLLGFYLEQFWKAIIN